MKSEECFLPLEFHRIREQAAHYAKSAEAERLLLAEIPVSDEAAFTEVRKRTAHIVTRLSSGEREPDGGLPDLSGVLPRLSVDQYELSLDEAFALGVFCDTGLALITWLAYPPPPP